MSTYDTIASFLTGMNQRQIDWVAANTMVTNLREDDAIVVAFKALLLHPRIFPSVLLSKNESESKLAWKRAEELGLSAEAAKENPWAMWLEGILNGLINNDMNETKHMFQLAADAGFALAQNSLGVFYQQDEQYELAEEYYGMAAEQGVADAQYNLAMLKDPEFELMLPWLEKAAAQGHIEARRVLAVGSEQLLHYERNETDEAPPHLPPMTDKIRRTLTCPISHEFMQDPVILDPTAETFDRGALCEWIVDNPTRHPITKVDFGIRLQYQDNIYVRALLIQYRGQGEYQRYDDSYLVSDDTATSTVPSTCIASLYELNIVALLFGMGRKKINWKMAQREIEAEDQNNPVILGLKALLLHPNVFPSTTLQKNEAECHTVWSQAEELGLTEQANDGNVFAQWLKGTYADIVGHDFETALRYHWIAANERFPMSENSVGELYERMEDSKTSNDAFDGDENCDDAMKYYELAAEQDHAGAQYNLAMMYDPDFERMKPYLQRAADQEHAESLFYLGIVYIVSDVVDQDFKKARTYFERAAKQGHAKAMEKLVSLYVEKGLEPEESTIKKQVIELARATKAISKHN